MSLECKQGIEYGCPYRKECESNEPMNICSINPQTPLLIYTCAKNWSNTTLTWANKDSLYACHPENSRRKRNIEIMHLETFYAEDAKQIRDNVLKEVQETINRLRKLKGGRS